MFAFLSTKLGMYLVGGLLVAALVGGGFLYVKHIRAQNADLKAQVAAYQLKAKILEKAAKAGEKFNQKKTTVQRRVVKEQSDVDQAVESGDLGNIVDMYRKLGVQPPDRNAAPGGAPGNP